MANTRRRHGRRCGRGASKDGFVGCECQCGRQSLQKTSMHSGRRLLRALASPFFHTLASPLWDRLFYGTAKCHGASGSHGAVEESESRQLCRAQRAICGGGCGVYSWLPRPARVPGVVATCIRRGSHDVHSLEEFEGRLGGTQLSRPESVSTCQKTL